VSSDDLAGRSIQQLLSLAGRHAVITGGARGIGLAIARRLAQAGAEILIGDRNARAAADAAASLERELRIRALSEPLDVCDPGSVARLAEVAQRKFGGIQIWVNNAGIYPPRTLLDTPDEEWDQVLATNLKGVFLGCREAGRRMAAAKSGVIINITSVSGYRGRPAMAHYVASKHGVDGLTKALAMELGPHGVRVVAVSPALTETPGYNESMNRGADAPSQQSYHELHARLRALVPLGRIGQPDDVARAVLFAVSDLAAFVTGTTIFADGGVSVF
jgi:NAD(P)-dependent dehydrogenase (short-subunit alcohol dehydrogenase family)